MHQLWVDNTFKVQEVEHSPTEAPDLEQVFSRPSVIATAMSPVLACLLLVTLVPTVWSGMSQFSSPMPHLHIQLKESQVGGID